MFKSIKSNIINQNSQIIKSNLFFFTYLLKNKLKKNILFIFPKTLTEQTQFFLNSLSSNNFLIISKWADGLITNYHQMSKSYKNLETYNFLTQLDITCIDFIILSDMPEKNSSMYNELLTLKTNFGIKIISFINIDNITTAVDHTGFIDIPLFYTNKNSDNIYPSLNFLHFYLLSFLLK